MSYRDHDFIDHDTIQQKAVIRPLVNGFADGERVPIIEPAELSQAERLILSLRGLDIGAAVQAVQIFVDNELETRMDERTDQRCADLLARIVHRIGVNTPEGYALKSAILGFDESYRDAAKRIGNVSHIALWKRVKKILRKLGVTPRT